MCDLTAAQSEDANFGRHEVPDLGAHHRSVVRNVEHLLDDAIRIAGLHEHAGKAGFKQLRGGGRGIYSNQLDPKYVVLGNLLTQNATPANVTAAQAIVPGLKLPFPTFVGTIAQMLRPFPQYGGIGSTWVGAS